jgi:tight adherence protein B
VLSEAIALLNAGISPAQVKAHLDDFLEPSVGPDKLGSQQQMLLNSVFEFAEEQGAGVCAVFLRLQSVFESVAEAHRQVALAAVAPKATARLVIALPVVTLLLTQLAGLNPLRVLLTNAFASVSVLAGIGLLFAASRWSGRLIAKATATQPDEALVLDLATVALSAGRTLPDSIAFALEKLNSLDTAIELSPELKAGIRRTRSLSESLGVPTAQLLAALADRWRAQQQNDRLIRIEKLSVSLMLPLGLAVLPAFLLITVLPVMLTLLAN